MRNKFPQIPRIFPSRIGGVLSAAAWGALVGVCILNLFAEWIYRIRPENQVRMHVFTRPFDAETHEELAFSYIDRNRDAAKREFAIAQFLFVTTNYEENRVLGAETEPWHVWERIASYSARLDEERRLWERIGELLPSYYYTKIKLAALYQLVGEDRLSDAALEDVLKEYPEDPVLVNVSAQLTR